MRVNLQGLLDLLFRVGLYRGTRVKNPSGLIVCSSTHYDGMVHVYETAIDDQHELADWLLYECDGPWRIGMERPLYYRRTYLAFARVSDAVTLRLLM